MKQTFLLGHSTCSALATNLSLSSSSSVGSNCISSSTSFDVPLVVAEALRMALGEEGGDELVGGVVTVGDSRPN